MHRDNEWGHDEFAGCDSNSSTTENYSEVLQDRLLEGNIRKFDWVIIDEGQDFLDEEMFQILPC